MKKLNTLILLSLLLGFSAIANDNVDECDFHVARERALDSIHELGKTKNLLISLNTWNHPSGKEHIFLTSFRYKAHDRDFGLIGKIFVNKKTCKVLWDLKNAEYLN